MSDEDLARRLQHAEYQGAEANCTNADLGHVDAVNADLQEQVPYTFTDGGGVLFNQIRAYRPRYYGPRPEVDLTGQNLAQAVQSAFESTTQHARNVDKHKREGMSFAQLLEKLSKPGETSVASIYFDRTSFRPPNATNTPAQLREDLFNGCAMLTTKRLLFLTASGSEVVHINGGHLPNFMDANVGCCTKLFDCIFCRVTPEPGFHYNVSTTKESGNTYVPIELKDIQRGICFTISSQSSFAGGVTNQRQIHEGDACCSGCCPGFIYPPAFDTVRNESNTNKRQIELGMLLPPWGERSTACIFVKQSEKLSNITTFVSKLQGLASLNASIATPVGHVLAEDSTPAVPMNAAESVCSGCGTRCNPSAAFCTICGKRYSDACAYA